MTRAAHAQPVLMSFNNACSRPGGHIHTGNTKHGHNKQQAPNGNVILATASSSEEIAVINNGQHLQGTSICQIRARAAE